MMGTRATIGLANPDGAFDLINPGQEGYPALVGDTLSRHCPDDYQYLRRSMGELTGPIASTFPESEAHRFRSHEDPARAFLSQALSTLAVKSAQVAETAARSAETAAHAGDVMRAATQAHLAQVAAGKAEDASAATYYSVYGNRGLVNDEELPDVVGAAASAADQAAIWAEGAALVAYSASFAASNGSSPEVVAFGANHPQP